MSEEIDKHVLKKYEVQQRLGKGVSALCPPAPPGASSHWPYVAMLRRLATMAVQAAVAQQRTCGSHAHGNPAERLPHAGVWHCVEGDRQEDQGDGGAEEDL